MKGRTKNGVSVIVLAKPRFANGMTRPKLRWSILSQSAVMRLALNPFSRSPVGADKRKDEETSTTR
jgi:hypothetical protein